MKFKFNESIPENPFEAVLLNKRIHEVTRSQLIEYVGFELKIYDLLKEGGTGQTWPSSKGCNWRCLKNRADSKARLQHWLEEALGKCIQN